MRESYDTKPNQHGQMPEIDKAKLTVVFDRVQNFVEVDGQFSAENYKQGQAIALPIKKEFPESVSAESPFDKIVATYFPQVWEQSPAATPAEIKIIGSRPALVMKAEEAVTEIQLRRDSFGNIVLAEVHEFCVDSEEQLSDYRFSKLSAKSLEWLDSLTKDL